MGEARRDAAADQHDQRHKRRDAGAKAEIGSAGDEHLGMKGDIRRRQQADEDERFQIAPIAPHHDLARHDHEEAGEKRTVDQDRRKRTRDADREKREPAQAPEREK